MAVDSTNTIWASKYYTTLSSGGGSAGPTDSARPGPDGASGGGDPGPYPILVYEPDTEYFSGKDGTQKGIT